MPVVGSKRQQEDESLRACAPRTFPADLYALVCQFWYCPCMLAGQAGSNLDLAIANGCVCCADAAEDCGLFEEAHCETVCEVAARNGHLELLQWARSRGHPWDTWTCVNNATRNGHLALLQWIREVEPSCPWDWCICSSAAAGGHLELLQWAHDNGRPRHVRTCTAAAEGGHLQLLQWAHDNGCPWNKWTCAAAAAGGHLELLQWARSQECPWSAETCANAAVEGHLELLRWLRRQVPPCPWDYYTCSGAAQGGHLKILRWLRLQGPVPCPRMAFYHSGGARTKGGQKALAAIDELLELLEPDQGSDKTISGRTEPKR